MKPKEPPKQEPKREWIFITIVLCVLIGTNFGLAPINGWVVSKVEETNRLLSTFQRIGTVKDDRKVDIRTFGAICDGKHNDLQALIVADQYAVVYGGVISIPRNCLFMGYEVEKNDKNAKNAKVLEKLKSGPNPGLNPNHEEGLILNDPNLCYHWKTDCYQDDDIGAQVCDTVCHMQPE